MGTYPDKQPPRPDIKALNPLDQILPVRPRVDTLGVLQSQLGRREVRRLLLGDGGGGGCGPDRGGIVGFRIIRHGGRSM